ncbi:MAG: Sec-independent protein translocase protein TatB [Pseudomonadota bacterium]|nr:Sec-independent protein translocase protein TatB [Pseudomonadota bacterium]
MFNIHSTEILLILIVALLVIGPERLPAAIKTAGLWMGRFRRSFYKVKAEIERELNTDEIRRQLHNESVIEEVEKAKSRVEGIAKETETSVNKIVSSENFDPGASQATNDQSSEEKSIKEELQEVGDSVEEVTKQIYSGGENPKLVKESTEKGKTSSEREIKSKNGIS